MRIFEILILLMILPQVIGLFIKPTNRPSWLSIFAYASVLWLICHLSFEGDRFFMIPAYVLTAIFFIMAIIKGKLSRSSEKSIMQRIPVLRIVTAIFVLILFIGATIFPIGFPVFNLPNPSGDHTIGSTTFHFEDSSRKELFTKDDSDYREIMVQAWYPAMNISPKKQPMAYMENPPFYLNHLSLVSTHAFKNVNVSDQEKTYPVIIYSHGYPLPMNQNTWLMEEFASHGYIILSIGHPYESITTVFPDGKRFPINFNRVKLVYPEFIKYPIKAINSQIDLSVKKNIMRTYLNNAPNANQSFHIWEKDTTFVLNQLEKINSGAIASPLVNKMDLERIGIMGHSFGGAIAGQMCLIDKRCKAGINLDGIQFGKAIDTPLNTPFMFVYSEGFAGANDVIYEQSLAKCFRMTIKGTEHFNFSELPLWSPVPRSYGFKGPINSLRALQLINRYTLAFFDRFVKQNHSPSNKILDENSTEFPEVDIKDNS